VLLLPAAANLTPQMAPNMEVKYGQPLFTYPG
jgi:hypothetical protein